MAAIAETETYNRGYDSQTRDARFDESIYLLPRCLTLVRSGEKYTELHGRGNVQVQYTTWWMSVTQIRSVPALCKTGEIMRVVRSPTNQLRGSRGIEHSRVSFGPSKFTILFFFRTTRPVYMFVNVSNSERDFSWKVDRRMARATGVS